MMTFPLYSPGPVYPPLRPAVPAQVAGTNRSRVSNRTGMFAFHRFLLIFIIVLNYFYYIIIQTISLYRLNQ